MPELPEVETTRRSLIANFRGARVDAVLVREPRLRQPVPADLAQRLPGQTLRELQRRAKYLLLAFDQDTLIVHLGMSGSLRGVDADMPLRKHDHVDLVFAGGAHVLRYHDPRRFGQRLRIRPEQLRPDRMLVLVKGQVPPPLGLPHPAQPVRRRKLRHQQPAPGLGVCNLRIHSLTCHKCRCPRSRF